MDESDVLECDDQMLIDMVKTYPCLYDKNAPDFKDQTRKEIAWAAIASVLAFPVPDIIKRWNSLRTQYSRYRRKKKTLLSGPAAGAHKPWHLGESLVWLNPYVQPRKTSSSIVHEVASIEIQHLKSSPSPWDICSTVLTPESSVEVTPGTLDDVSLPSTSSASTLSRVTNGHPDNFRVAKKKKVDNMQKVFIETLSSLTEILKNKTKEAQPEPKDEDGLFADSIACMLRRLNNVEKCEVKLEIMKSLLLRQKVDE